MKNFRDSVAILPAILVLLLLICPQLHTSVAFSVYRSKHNDILGRKKDHSVKHTSSFGEVAWTYHQYRRIPTFLSMSDWSGFADDYDDDPLYGNASPADSMQFASENDDAETKAAVGSQLPAPEKLSNVDPIFVPQGTALPLTEENVEGVLAACQEEIGTLFGYTAENRGVGITGGVDFVELDGPVVILSLKGRFWHTRPMVLERVGAYIMGRIPEVVDVDVLDPYELTQEANDAAA